MDSKKSFGMGIMVAALGATGAQAGLISVSETISLNQVLNGGSTSALFNIGSILDARNLQTTSIVSGSVAAYGASEAFYNREEPQPYSAYNVTETSQRTVSRSYYRSGYRSCSYSSWGSSSCYYYPGQTYTYYTTVQDQTLLRSRDILNIDDVADTLEVSAGGVSATDSVDQLSTSTSPYGEPQFDGSAGSDSYGYSYYYSQERDTYEAIFGELEVLLDLEPGGLNELRTDGKLNVGLSALLGQMYLSDLTLTLQVDDNSEPVTVPEPGSLALFGISASAMASFALRRRRKHKE